MVCKGFLRIIVTYSIKITHFAYFYHGGVSIYDITNKLKSFLSHFVYSQIHSLIFLLISVDCPLFPCQSKIIPFGGKLFKNGPSKICLFLNSLTHLTVASLSLNTIRRWPSILSGRVAGWPQKFFEARSGALLVGSGGMLSQIIFKFESARLA